MIKTLAKKIITPGLWFLAKLIVKKYQPKIVGVTGSVGKTGTKDAIALVLASNHNIRASAKSYNSEVGIPLTIIGAKSPWTNPLGWLKVFYQAFKVLLTKQDYPAWLVLEVGADRPGDIKKVASQLKFDIAVLTKLPDLPVHVEFFPNTEAVVEEKLALAKAVSETGIIILNADDEKQLAHRQELVGKVITYGLSESDVHGGNINLNYEGEGEGRKLLGLTFKLEYESSSLPVRLAGLVGKHQVYPVLAAAAVALQSGVNLIQVGEALSRLESPPGRLRLLPGIKKTLILDDTYNASPAALSAGLAAVREIEVLGRKWVVIGDMLELGDHTIEAHKEAGREASQVAETILTVGIRSRFVAEGAKEKGFSLKKIHHFHDAAEVGIYLQKNIKAGDLIYLK
ncbi:MAG: hypothetical protein KBC48_03325, partial [Candidatus Pacebacteria bacterium]|nr:hypothetical protein [Candidatus Paceibacterota bacterium]